jgi:hypothetical protein
VLSCVVWCGVVWMAVSNFSQVNLNLSLWLMLVLLLLCQCYSCIFTTVFELVNLKLNIVLVWQKNCELVFFFATINCCEMLICSRLFGMLAKGRTLALITVDSRKWQRTS